MYLITTFFKVSRKVGWLLLCLWYVFYMTLFLIIFFLHFPLTSLSPSMTIITCDIWIAYFPWSSSPKMEGLSTLFTGLVLVFFPGWQAQNNLKCAQYSCTCAERNRTFNQIVVVLQLPLLCIHCKNIRSSEIACSPVVPLNLKSLPSKLKTGHQRRLKQSDKLPVY